VQNHSGGRSKVTKAKSDTFPAGSSLNCPSLAFLAIKICSSLLPNRIDAWSLTSLQQRLHRSVREGRRRESESIFYSNERKDHGAGGGAFH
jgi:hypothetical protein